MRITMENKPDSQETLKAVALKQEAEQMTTGEAWVARVQDALFSYPAAWHGTYLEHLK